MLEKNKIIQTCYQGKIMKKILFIAACALLSPMHQLDAAPKVATTKRTAARKTVATKKAAPKAGTKKTAAARKTTAAKSTKPRVRTTTAGSKTTKPVASKAKATAAKAKPAAKKTTAARTKTTTAGTKARAAKRTSHTTKAQAASRAKKTTYSSTKKPATKRAAAPKKATSVTYRHFNHLKDMEPQALGTIKKPLSLNIALNQPGRGYVNANLITFTIPDGKEGQDDKEGQVVLDTHTITAARAERKGFAASTHGKRSVEIFAGADATDKGLALIGEYPLTNNADNVSISVDPNGHVVLEGAGKPVEFSIHQ